MAAKTEKKEAVAMMPNTEEQSKESEALCTVIDDLKAKLSIAKLRIEAQNEKIDALDEQVTILSGSEPMTYQESVATTRTALLLALAPNMNLAYPREDAQRIEKAVDEILKVWGV